MRVLFLSLVSLLGIANAQFDTQFNDENPVKIFRGKIIEVQREGEEDFFGVIKKFQEFKIKVLSGEKKNEVLEIPAGNYQIVTEEQKLKKGESVVMGEFSDNLVIMEVFRLPFVIILCLFFVLVVGLVGKSRGIFALGGLLFSIFVIAQFIIPHILSGSSPLIVSCLGALIIMIVSLLVSHGFSKKTLIAMLATFLILCLTIGLSYFAVLFTRLFGLGSETTYYFSYGGLGNIDLRGLLLGGIIIGTLGILDDITTTQVSTVFELSKANLKLGFRELYLRAFRVGQHHIASLINTLALAYIGANFPLFLWIYFKSEYPWWAIFNSEFISEEIVRTVVGSLALVLAVPLSTLLAAIFYGRKR